MKKKLFWFAVVIFSGIMVMIIIMKFGLNKPEPVVLIYPKDQTVFPKDMAPPAFAWKDDNPGIKKWQITVKTGESTIIDNVEVAQKSWKPTVNEWKSILASGIKKKYSVTIQGKSFGWTSKANVTFSISVDPVDASIFFRSVPLPFKFARENMKRIKWYLGDVSSDSKPHAVLQNMPVCANCHSFSKDGKTIAMDVDAIDDKGAYDISSFSESTKFASDSIMSWSKFQMGKFTYGLLSQISPDGRYVVSTLRDCEIFVDRKDLEYSQLFFPFKGILVVYDRKSKRYTELAGANDSMFVHSNPCWTPDGKSILFSRAKAKHFNESGIHNGSVAKQQDLSRYKKFEKSYLDRDSLFKFDVFTIPFNNGKGGIATPVEGASKNGLSNYFPRVSPDGKWLLFCQAESFMLLQKDSKLVIVPATGGKPRVLNGNSQNMNSWHSWSPNSKWLIYSSKALGPYTQLFLTHINEDGTDTPPVYLDNFSFPEYASNIPEFVNTKYNKNFKIEPDFLAGDDFLIRNGEIHQNTGDDQDAFEDFDAAVKRFPDNSESYYKRGRIFFQRNQYTEALKDLNQALDLKKDINYFVTRGIIKIKMGDNQSAIKDLDDALKIDSTDTNANSYLGIAYTQIEKIDLAIPYLKKAVRLNPEDYYSSYYLGLDYFEKGQFKEAELAFNSAIRYCTAPKLFPLMYEMRGNTLAKLGNFDAAITDFDSAIKYAQNDPSSYYEKGKVLLEMRRDQEAITILKQAEQLGSRPAADLLRTIAR
jgi:tetratricopeptide (TPR) repeat protein/Tol biopolymer transport system component